MNIRTRVFYLLVPIAIIAVLLTFFAIRMASASIVHQWTQNLIQREAQNMIERSVQPIANEIKLAQRLAGAPEVMSWANNPDSPELKNNALTFVNNYKKQFQSQSFFVALKKNNHYYHNNQRDEFTNNEFRYVLDPNNASDSWFYTLLASEQERNLNVDLDRELKLLQLWINVPIRYRGETLGLIGTGFNLNDFIKQKLSSFDTTYSVILVDHAGAIQLDQNTANIVFGSAGMDTKSKPTIFESLNHEDAVALQSAMQTAQGNPEINPIIKLHWEDREQYAGVIFIPAIDWYQINLVDINKALPQQDFYSLFIILLAMILLTFIVIQYGLHRYVVQPLEALRNFTVSFKNERKAQPLNKLNTTEFEDLHSEFLQLTEEVQRNEKHLEGKIAQRTRELIHAEKLAALGTIAAGVAHEINNPLGFIQSNLGLISDYLKTIEPRVRDHLQYLKSQPDQSKNTQADIEDLEFVLDDIDDVIVESSKGCNRIRHIVQGLKEYSQQDKGIIEEFSLNDIASMAIDLKINKLKDDVKFEFELSPDMPLINLDPKAITQVVANLLCNAAYAVTGCENPLITLKTFASEDTIGIEVTDNGTGISEENLAKLFTPFFTTKPIGSGMGLSLAVSLATVRSLDGNIEVASELGKGSRFKLVFQRPN